MPGLLRGIARTAVVAGTASAVSGRVQRRQARRWAREEPALEAPFQQLYAAPTPAPAVPARDPIQQLKDLADLRSQGILSDDEFATPKARILAG